MSPIEFQSWTHTQSHGELMIRAYYAGVDGDGGSSLPVIADSLGSTFTMQAIYFWFSFNGQYLRAFSHIKAWGRYGDR